MKIVLVTGGFDPIHSGHIAYFRDARSLGDKLIVGVNSDAWLTRKKGRPFMPVNERVTVIENLRMVDHCILYNDDDGSSTEAIRNLLTIYPTADIIFANGGDRTDKNIPEMVINDPRVSFVFGVGGFRKANSSSWILEEWKAPKTPRAWGYYRVLHDVPGTKVKELTVDPGCSLSMQRHTYRDEYWHIASGACAVNSKTPGGYQLPPTLLKEHQYYKVPRQEWHQITNPYETPCKIVEIQYGEKCHKEDIERE